jgi:hypothetical protein
VDLASANSAALAAPASVAFTPGAKTAAFPLTALHVAQDTTVAVSAGFGTITHSATVTVGKEPASVVVRKAEYVVKKSLLTVEATSPDRVMTLQVFNPSTGAILGTLPLVTWASSPGKFRSWGAQHPSRCKTVLEDWRSCRWHRKSPLHPTPLAAADAAKFHLIGKETERGRVSQSK